MKKYSSHPNLKQNEFDLGDTPALSPKELSLFQGLMRQYAGVCLPDTKVSLIRNRLRKHLDVLGLSSFTQYYQYITVPGHEEELQHCINSLTTNETYFFRHKEHWDMLWQTIVPEWINRNKRGSTFQFWSAAASTGAEAYSAAMTFSVCLPPSSGYKFSILATDINETVLQAARTAEYNDYALQKINPAALKQYFIHDSQRGRYHLDRRIANLVQFRMHNLIETLRGPKFDVVFLRNVLIYFDEEGKQRVLERVTEKIAEGGYLFLGGAEALSCMHQYFQRIKPTVYRRI